MVLTCSNIVNTEASRESVSKDLVNMVEDYNTVEDLAITGSESRVEKWFWQICQIHGLRSGIFGRKYLGYGYRKGYKRRVYKDEEKHDS